MITRQFTRDELQQAFALAFVLHPSPEVAFCVLIKAMKLTVNLELTEARRQRSTEHYKSPIPPEALLQFAVFFASFRWELDQESPLPKKEPRYKPTRDDMLVRYLKHLVWNNLVKINFSSLGIGLGCLLYDYKPKQIADLLGLSDELSIHRIKRSIRKQLMKRFKYAGVLTAEGDDIRTKPANDYDRELVREALKFFAPWNTTHIPLAPGESLLEKLVEEPDLTDWDFKHALLDPECGGLDQLIIQHNNLYARHGEDLEDPNLQLFVPDFMEDLPTPPVDRFKAPRLTDHEILLLNKLSGARVPDVEGLLSDLYQYGVDESLIEVFDDRVGSINNSPPLLILLAGNYVPCGPFDSSLLTEEEGDAMEKREITIPAIHEIDWDLMERELTRMAMAQRRLMMELYPPDPYLIEVIEWYLKYQDMLGDNIDMLATYRCLRVLGGRYTGFMCSVPGGDLWISNHSPTIWDSIWPLFPDLTQPQMRRYSIANISWVDEREPGGKRVYGYGYFAESQVLVVTGCDQQPPTTFLKTNGLRTHGPSVLTTFHSMEQEQLKDLKPYVPDPGLLASDWYDSASARRLQEWFLLRPKKTDIRHRQPEPWGESSFPLWGMNLSANPVSAEADCDES